MPDQCGTLVSLQNSQRHLRRSAMDFSNHCWKGAYSENCSALNMDSLHRWCQQQIRTLFDQIVNMPKHWLEEEGFAWSTRSTHPLCDALSQRGLLDPIKLAYDQCQPDGRLKLTPSAFNRLSQYDSSPGHWTYCYTELAVSSLVIAETITSTHTAYPWRDGQAELTWVAG